VFLLSVWKCLYCFVDMDIKYNIVIKGVFGGKMLQNQDKAIETLTGLGLTSLQAKVYLTLAKEGKSTAKDLAKSSKVARQDLYRIAPQLLNLGLVEKLVDTPTRYQAIPIQAATNMLIERRKKETAKLEQESSEFVKLFNAKSESTPKEVDPQFVIINDLQARLSKGKRQMANAKKSVKIVTKWSVFLTYTLETLQEHIDAMNNGVKVKIVTQKPEGVKVLPRELQKLMRHPNFEIRHVANVPSSIVAIFDNSEVNILLASDKAPAETGMLMSNSLSLIELATNYFEIMWANGVRDQSFSMEAIERLQGNNIEVNAALKTKSAHHHN